MGELGAEGFVRQHLGLDHAELQQSGLAQHLGQITPAVQAYFRHYFHELWQAPRFAARARACVAMLDRALDVDFRPEMAAHQRVARLIWGDRDRVFGHKFVTRLSEAFPRAELSVLEGIGHYAPLEAPERVAEVMLAAVRAEET
jgi:pimeloyl-ACP methyl ester carboxylesterase